MPKSGPGLRTALETPQRIDELFIERSAQPVTDRLHVLSGEENLIEQINYQPGAAARLIETLRRRYNFIVIDAPFTGLQLHRDLLMLGHQRILVLEPTLVAVRDALRLLALPNGPLQVHRGLLVLNRLNRPGTLTRRQIEDALKMKVDVAIPDLPKLVENAASMGEPAALHGRFNKGIIALAAQAAAAFPVDSSPEAPAHRCERGWRRLWPFRHVSEEASRLVRASPGSGSSRSPSEAEAPPAAPRLPPGAAIVELRALCLGEMDPTSLAKLTPEELTQEVERTLAEIATQRRIQLNGREQRALARELVNDMLGSARSSRCWKTTRSPTSWSTDRRRCSSSVAASSICPASGSAMPAMSRMCASGSRRGSGAASTKATRWWMRG